MKLKTISIQKKLQFYTDIINKCDETSELYDQLFKACAENGDTFKMSSEWAYDHNVDWGYQEPNVIASEHGLEYTSYSVAFSDIVLKVKFSAKDGKILSKEITKEHK